MTDGDRETVTRLLKDVVVGNRMASEELVPLAYKQVGNLAQVRLRQLPPDANARISRGAAKSANALTDVMVRRELDDAQTSSKPTSPSGNSRPYPNKPLQTADLLRSLYVAISDHGGCAKSTRSGILPPRFAPRQK